MRLLFVCRMFADGVGGVERISIRVMNAMVERGHEVSLFTWDVAGARAFYPMHERVRWHQLDMGDPMQPASAALRVARVRRFRALTRVSRPGAVVAFQHGPFLFATAGAAGRRIPVVLSERNAPELLDHTRAGRYRDAIFQSMRLARAITVQFPGYVQRYPSYLRGRIAVVPNPVERAAEFAAPGADRAERTLLAVGRLSFQKNFAVLVRAFASLSQKHPAWRLRIVGDGEERAALADLIDQAGVRGRVELAAPVRHIAAEYAGADLFCLPSRWEGFPNALAEAMAHGLPAVGFGGCAGVNELIVPGENGLLADGADDPAALAAALDALMSDAPRRARMGATARGIADTYQPARVFDTWESLLRRVAGNR